MAIQSDQLPGKRTVGNGESAESRDPKQQWTGGITYSERMKAGLYLAVVNNLLLRVITGWSMPPGMRVQRDYDALQMAL